MAASLVGRKLGKYEIVQLLGHGGMATVYKGRQPDIDRFVAVKVLPPHPGQNAQFIERFRLEARTIARLQHPHILPVFDYGSEDGILYLVMPHIDGGSLSDRIRRGPMQIEEIDRLLQQIAGALDYAHRQGIIHRDIKPDNVLLDREGHALLADFGIVKLIESAPVGSTLTATGGLVGTPAYMSPEQAQGTPIDHRSDIYSLGIVVYEMLTGRQPFTADTPMQVVFKHITEPVPLVRSAMPALPPELDDVMRRVLAKDPVNRYMTAQAFADDFRRASRGEKTITPLPGDMQIPIISPPRTTAIEPPPTQAAVPTPAPQGTTVVTPAALNPLLLLGGFAIMALLMIAVVALILNNNRAGGAATEVAAIPTSAVEPTVQPTVQPTVEAAVQPTNEPSTAVAQSTSFGAVNFSSTNQMGDTVSLQVNNLAQPRSGQVYAAWLHNTGSGESLALGRLRVDGLGSGSLIYTDEAGNALPALYNAVLVTQEQEIGDAPSDNVAYSAAVPVEVAQALNEILIAAPDGIDGGSLIAGALEEASIAQHHAGLAAQATSAGAMHNHAEHTINILQGTNDDYDGNNRPENPGRGVGVTPLLDLIWSKLDAAAQAPNSNRLVQSQAELIRTCIHNSSTRVDGIITLEQELLASDDPAALQSQMTRSTDLAQALIGGVDLNGNGQVEPFEGECGLEQITTYGIYVANMNIFAGALAQGD